VQEVRNISSKDAADKLVKGIRRKTRKQYSAEEEIRIVLAGLRGEESIAALFRREGISENLYCTWSKGFFEAGKQGLAGDTARQATSLEVKELRAEFAALKQVGADLTLENRLLKKSMPGMGSTRHEVSCIGKAGDHPYSGSRRFLGRTRPRRRPRPMQRIGVAPRWLKRWVYRLPA
jgi:transposase